MTSIFKNFSAAKKYYKTYGFDNEDVQNKIDDGEITINPVPETVNPGLSGYWDADDRFIEDEPEWMKKAEERLSSGSVIDSLRKLRVASETRVILPEDRISHYDQVKNLIEKAGGRYSRGGFSFKKDAISIMQRLCDGEKINDKKKYQFFETVQSVGERMVELCGPLKGGEKWLEPQAGHGALAKLIPEEIDDKPTSITAVELDPEKVSVLEEMNFFDDIFVGDFLTMDPDEFIQFDFILANPPFGNNQYIDHIYHMVKFLKKGGCLVTLAPSSWLHNDSINKVIEFRKWFSGMNSSYEIIEAGTFKESGTGIETCIIKISY